MIRGSGFSNNRAIATGLGGSTSSGAVATVTVLSQGYYGEGTASVSVNLLGLDPALAPLSQYPNNVVLFVLIMGVGIAVGGFLGRRRDGPGIWVPSQSGAPPTPAPPPPPNSSAATPTPTGPARGLGRS